jgi:hypothetical protein
MITGTEMFIEPSADVASGARIGAGTRVWHQAQVADDVEIGIGCTLGKSCYVGAGSRIGDHVKVGNHADVFGARIDSEVMISPQAVLTEDRTPRATRPTAGARAWATERRRRSSCAAARPSAPVPASHPASRSGRTPWSASAPSSCGTSPRTPWSWAIRRARSAGSAAEGHLGRPAAVPAVRPALRTGR